MWGEQAEGIFLCLLYVCLFGYRHYELDMIITHQGETETWRWKMKELLDRDDVVSQPQE